jgi:hypothetical protein
MRVILSGKRHSIVDIATNYLYIAPDNVVYGRFEAAILGGQ